MRSRFGMSHALEFYSEADLLSILERSASLLNLPAGQGEALDAVAGRSRGTPRIANRLLRRVRDFSQVRAEGKVNVGVVRDALELEGIDDLGLDDLDRRYMKAIAQVYEGGPVGLEAVAATMGEDAGTLEDVVEPFLLQLGFVARTRRGRQLTRAGAAHIGYRLATDDEPAKLFEGD
jgi:Holliday junction DNA helicase RuvB